MFKKWVSKKKLFKALLVLLLVVPSTCNKNINARTFKADIRSSGITTFRPSFAFNHMPIDSFFNASKRPEEYMEIRSPEAPKRSKNLENTHISDNKKEKIVTSKSSKSSSKVMSGVNDILVEAMKAYDGPEIIVTSGLRHSGYKRSLHRVGKAIDIHFCEEFVMWCELDAGKKWLRENNLEFFVEDNREREFDENILNKHFRKIPWATNLHIHLNMKQ